MLNNELVWHAALHLSLESHRVLFSNRFGTVWLYLSMAYINNNNNNKFTLHVIPFLKIKYKIHFHDVNTISNVPVVLISFFFLYNYMFRIIVVKQLLFVYGSFKHSRIQYNFNGKK